MARDPRGKTGIYRGGLDDAPISAKAKVVVVHDCSQPIARAVALHLADRGQCVLACGTDPLSLLDLPRETALGGLVEVSSAPIGALRERALELFGRIDAVVAVAEVPPELTWGPFEAHDPGPVLELGLLAPTRFARAISLALTTAGQGRLVLVNTTPGLPFGAAAAAARGGIEGLADALRLELAPLGVDVVLVSPELVVPPPPAPSPTAALDAALTRLGPGRPRQVLGAPLRALVARAATHASIAEATLQALTEARPKPRIAVRSGGRLLAARASRALEREANRGKRRE